MARNANAQLLALRNHRNRPQRDTSIATDVDRAIRAAAKASRSFGAVGEAWERIVPAHLRAGAHLDRMRSGTLTVRMPDAAARFELDRFLRAGGEAALIRASAAALKRVRITP